MIYVVEMPAGGAPRAWFAFDADDLLAKVAIDDERAMHEIWHVATARDLLALFDEAPTADGVDERHPAISELAAAHGWDTPLYRADYLRDPSFYTPTPVRAVDACAAALRARGGDWRIYEGEPVALAAADAPDSLFDRSNGWQARLALRRQLVAVEALSDDL